MNVSEALVYEKLRYKVFKRDMLSGKASLWEKRQCFDTLEAINNLESLERQYGSDAIVDADGEVLCSPATEEDLQDHVDGEMSEDMRLALEQCDPFNYN